ncbi:hypothetical protein D3C71_1222910 [compost metagenome]
MPVHIIDALEMVHVADDQRGGVWAAVLVGAHARFETPAVEQAGQPVFFAFMPHLFDGVCGNRQQQRNRQPHAEHGKR